MTKEYVKYSGADVELVNNGETLLIDKASSVEIKGSKVYVTLAVIDNDKINGLTKGSEFSLSIISPLTDVDSNKNTKLLKVSYDYAILRGMDVKFEPANAEGITYKFDVTFGNFDMSIIENKQDDLDTLMNKFIEQDKKIEQLANEMEEFRKLVLDKLDNLDKKDITVDLNRYTWESLSDSMMGGTLDKEYDTAKGSVTGGNIEFEKPTIINVSLNIENLGNAKDLVNKLSDELRTKGLW